MSSDNPRKEFLKNFYNNLTKQQKELTKICSDFMLNLQEWREKYPDEEIPIDSLFEMIQEVNMNQDNEVAKELERRRQLKRSLN